MSRSIFLSVAMPAIVASNCLNPSSYQSRLFRKKAELAAASISYLSALRAAALSRGGRLGWMLSLPRQCRPSSAAPCSFCRRDVPQVLGPRACFSGRGPQPFCPRGQVTSILQLARRHAHLSLLQTPSANRLMAFD